MPEQALGVDQVGSLVSSGLSTLVGDAPVERTARECVSRFDRQTTDTCSVWSEGPGGDREKAGEETEAPRERERESERERDTH